MNLFKPLGVMQRLLHSFFLRTRAFLPLQQSMAFSPAVVAGDSRICFRSAELRPVVAGNGFVDARLSLLQ